MRDMPFWFLLLIIIEQSVLKFQTNIRTTDSQEPVIRRRYRTLSQTREMTEESDARIKRLEKPSQNQQGQLAEIMKLLKTLVRDKAQAASQQNSVVQPKQRREDPTCPQGFTPPYTQAQPMPQMGGFPYGYAPPLTQTHEVGQNSRANTADPITIPDLDDPKEQEKIRNELLEQSESNKAQRKLELIKECLKAMEGSDVYGLVDAYKMSLVSDLVLPPKFKMPTLDKYDGTKCP